MTRSTPCWPQKDRWYPIATCNFIKKADCGHHGPGDPLCLPGEKTVDKCCDRNLTGVNCTAEFAIQNFMATKNLYGKANGAFFYQ